MMRNNSKTTVIGKRITYIKEVKSEEASRLNLFILYFSILDNESY